jgi:hypothetical protein
VDERRPTVISVTETAALDRAISQAKNLNPLPLDSRSNVDADTMV